MSTVTVRAPGGAAVQGPSMFGPVTLIFKDGECTVDEAELTDGVRAYLLSQGFGINTDATAPKVPPHAILIDGRPAPDSRTIPTTVAMGAFDPDI